LVEAFAAPSASSAKARAAVDSHFRLPDAAVAPSEAASEAVSAATAMRPANCNPATEPVAKG